MRHYPAFLDLSGKRCLVLGAGGVGLRKLRTILECNPAEVIVFEKAAPGGDLLELCQSPGVKLFSRALEPADLEGVFLAVAATSNAEANRSLALACAEKGILCNVADQPELSSFIVPSVINRGDLTLAISTSGQSPAVAKVLRKRLEESVGDEYARLLRLMGALRPLLLARGKPTAENTAVFRALAASPLLEALGAEDLDTAASILRETLPEDLHNTIGDLLDAVT